MSNYSVECTSCKLVSAHSTGDEYRCECGNTDYEVCDPMTKERRCPKCNERLWNSHVHYCSGQKPIMCAPSDPLDPVIDQALETVMSLATVPTEAKERKGLPVYSGVLMYFPDAILAVAELSRIGNDQHNPGEPLHWAKDKSKDHHDCVLRHIMDAGKIDKDGVRHSAKVAWRALAALQIEIEAEQKPVLVQCAKCYSMRKKSSVDNPCPTCGTKAVTPHNASD